MMANPPLVLLSLLPAPQQAILSANLDESYRLLYGNTNNSDNGTKDFASEEGEVSEEEEEQDDESDAEGEEESDDEEVDDEDSDFEED